MPPSAGDPVQPIPAATVVLLRGDVDELSALLTKRPSRMAFAADMHVFPGGRVDPADADPALGRRSVLSADEAAVALGGDLDPAVALAAHLAAIRELFEEAGVILADHSASNGALAAGRSALLNGRATLGSLAVDLDLRLRTDLLVPLSRWVTPTGLARRFDARFFAAELPAGATPSFEGGEVVEHRWLRPSAALEAMAAGRLSMWSPTSATLQQLEFARSLDQIRECLAPGLLGVTTVEYLSPEVIRIAMPAGGGVAGQPVSAYLIGRGRFVLVDPGDPTGPALDLAIEIASQRGGTIEAVALTHVDPDHAGGAAILAERLGIPILAGPGGGRPLPYEVRELVDREVVDAGDVPLDVVLTSGPRPDHVAYLVAGGAFIVVGDLDGPRGARSITGPEDRTAWAASLERVDRLAPGGTRLPGHPTSEAI